MPNGIYDNSFNCRLMKKILLYQNELFSKTHTKKTK